jgi:hypothetical protein
MPVGLLSIVSAVKAGGRISGGRERRSVPDTLLGNWGNLASTFVI